MKHRYLKIRNQSGSALISIIIIIPFLILITALYMELAVSSLTVARKDQAQTHAQFAVDAGIDYALQQLNDDTLWTGSGGETELQNDNGVRTTYETTLVQNSPTSKTLTAIGRAYRPAASTAPAASKTIRVDLRPVASGTYSVITGVGGLYMSNSAKILGGDVLVNGEINMSNSAQIGLSTNPVKVEVAHQNCPVPSDSTYPKLCSAGENGEPISISGMAWIYGSVKANNQTNGASMSSPGLVSGSVTPGALPTHDRAAQKTAISQTQTGATASCTGSQTRNWPANLKIDGDVTIGGGCKVTVNGNVWITGKLTMSNTTQLLVSSSVGTTRPDIMVDGAANTFSNSAAIVSNADKTGIRLITYFSKASCSPDCTNVTGTDLYNSRNEETIKFNNSAAAPESILYARWSRVSITNNGGIGALIGQTVNLSNSAAITFGSTAGTGSSYWVIDGYRRGY